MRYCIGTIFNQKRLLSQCKLPHLPLH
jgi:hypothetical protein